MAEKKSNDPTTNNLFIEPKDNTGAWRVGTSGWSYPPSSGPGSWTGVLYRPCAPKTAESWVKRTPEDFEFTVKAWQEFTHKKGDWTVEQIDEFKEGILPLIESHKLGCILFQFPASFRHTSETVDRLKALLDL